MHLFLLEKGIWKGNGLIQISMVKETLNFEKRWMIHSKDFLGRVEALQINQIEGLPEPTKNEYLFYNISKNSFTVELQSPHLGKIVGVGFIDEKSIGWEFRKNEKEFEGYETYHLQNDGSYEMQGEYITADHFRSKISSKLRRVEHVDKL
jgi:hypothetical protein